MDDIKRYAAYSMAAYSNIQPGGKFNCNSCRDPLLSGTTIVKSFVNEIPSSHGFIATNSNQKTIIICFRGTIDPVSFIQDAVLVPVPFPSNSNGGSKVHAGFLAAYRSVDDIIKDTLKDLLKKHPDYTVVFTGHSLGGAEALIAAVDIATATDIIPSACTVRYFGIGIPRTGNSAFAKLVNNARFEVVRTNNKADLVPRLPPRGAIFDYKHPDQEVWIRPFTGDVKVCNKAAGAEATEDESCINSVPALLLSVPDHLLYFNYAPDFLH
ncbi:alpha/beta-hydrolase [Ramicandelaber brevisporus]|nr:alpha/beta-hydrolase [Ramicandelaber brevisporus]